ncbi:MAG: ComEC/Rec2 family competence protein, partial [Bacteroidota bacterium]|nr:ComEC/Rec2 family competence protein [Bacteroidota bacterium]
MKAINHIPLLRPFIPFVAGIIFAVNEEVFDINISTVIFLTIILIINNFIPYFNSNYSYRWFFGFIACICFFLLGYKITINNNLTNKENHFSRFILSNKYFIAKVSDSKTEKEKTYKIIVDVIGTYQNNKFIKTTGKSLLYIQKDMSSGNINYGDVILIKNKFKELDPPYNPHAFDYKKYLAFQNISHKCYLYSNDWEMLNQKIYNPLINHSLIARHKILSVFRQNNFRGSEYSVAASLITGYTDNLDPELVREYTSAGVIHVLAVSGMHVALIYLIISKLLFFMGNRTYEKIIKAIISILLLWFYAAITGFCPSVLRAGVMFSFIIIGTTFDKNHNIINTLIASAFLLLIINPYFIMDVGFQLSYLSVIGIVSINNQLNSIAVNRNRIIRNIISVMFVTIAAQAFVFPLSLYYFHKFPIYFLPANMIVIPVSNIIIYLAISLLFFYPIKLIGSIISFTTVKSIYLLNNFINYIDHLPHSVINNIYINTIELLILYSIVILFFIYILKRTKFSLILSLTLLLIFISERTYQSYRQIHQHKLIVYYSPKSTVIEFINGKKAEL